MIWPSSASISPSDLQIIHSAWYRERVKPEFGDWNFLVSGDNPCKKNKMVFWSVFCTEVRMIISNFSFDYVPALLKTFPIPPLVLRGWKSLSCDILPSLKFIFHCVPPWSWLITHSYLLSVPGMPRFLPTHVLHMVVLPSGILSHSLFPCSKAVLLTLCISLHFLGRTSLLPVLSTPV